MLNIIPREQIKMDEDNKFNLEHAEGNLSEQQEDDDNDRENLLSKEQN